MVAGNPEPLRCNLYAYLSRYKKIDGFGNMFGNPLLESKINILPKYKFCLCPENSIYCGYITEKLLDAYAGSTIPVYSGDLNLDSDFNRHAFLNYYDGQDMGALLQYLIELDGDENKYQRIYREPLLLKEPSLDDAIAFVRCLPI